MSPSTSADGWWKIICISINRCSADIGIFAFWGCESLHIVDFSPTIASLRRQLDENEVNLQEEPAIAQFMQMAKEGKRRPTKEEWHRVFMLVERHYPGMLKIKSHKDVNPKEYRICVLLKLGLDIQSIKFVENTYNSDISVVRSRLLLKIYGIKGSSKDFDSRLAEI